MFNRRISDLRRSASLFMVKASRSSVIFDSNRSGRQAADVFPSAPSSSPVGSEVRLHLIPWDPDCRQDLEWWIVPGRLQAGISLAQVYPHLDFWSDASDVG